MPEGGFIAVMMTAPDEAVAAEIGGAAVKKGLAACCTIVPRVRSLYKWKGEFCDEAETLCIFKTRKALFEGLKAHIKSVHPYEVPEIIAVGIDGGLKEYLEWVESETKGR